MGSSQSNDDDQVHLKLLLMAIENDDKNDVVETLAGRSQCLNMDDENGISPLKLAIKKNKISMAEFLLSVDGINVNSKSYVDGTTPLMFASMENNAFIAQMLVVKGSKINDVDLESEWSALHHATHCQAHDAMLVLLDLGAEPDNPDSYGQTPLHLASMNGDLEALRILIDRGCGIEAVDRDGLNAIQVCDDVDVRDALEALIQSRNEDTESSSEEMV